MTNKKIKTASKSRTASPKKTLAVKAVKPRAVKLNMKSPAPALAPAPVAKVAKEAKPNKRREKPIVSLPFLHRKRFAIPLLLTAFLAIAILLLLPSLPQVQSTAQGITKNNKVLAAVVPNSFKPPDVSLPTSGNWLVIPEIDIKMAIIEGPNLDVLNSQVGIWHQVGEPSGNYVLAGHRLQYFRSVNESLYHLDRMEVGDMAIYVVTNGVAQEYKVTDKRVVPPTSVEILNPTPDAQLTIYTCNDFNNQKRLVVTAVPIEPKQKDEPAHPGQFIFE